MSGPNRTLVKTFTAEAAITKHRIVKFGAANGQVLQAAAVGDAMFGAAAELDVAINDRVDVQVAGIAEIEAGAAIALGALVTSDAVGRAVAAAPVAGTNNRIIGTAMTDALALGDIIPVLLAPGQIQG